jgi:hypothetical protein
MLLSMMMFCIGSLLVLPGIGTGLCAMMLHTGDSAIFPGWFVRMSLVMALVGAPMATWAFWRMIR